MSLELSRVYVVVRDERSLHENPHHRELLSKYGGYIVYGIRRLVDILHVVSGSELRHGEHLPGERSPKTLPALSLSQTDRRVTGARLLSGLNFCAEAIGLTQRAYPTARGRANRRELLEIERYCRRELNEYSKCRELTQRIAKTFGLSRRELLEEDLSLGLLTHDFALAEQACTKLLRLSSGLRSRSPARGARDRYLFHMARLQLYKIIMGQSPKKQLTRVKQAFHPVQKVGWAGRKSRLCA